MWLILGSQPCGAAVFTFGVVGSGHGSIKKRFTYIIHANVTLGFLLYDPLGG